MKLQIMEIIDRGVANKERLWMRVLADTNLQFYIVFDTVYTSANAISSSQKHAFWFPPTPVKAGDNVILVTGPGTRSQTLNSSGGTDHFFHWGFPNTIWNQKEDCAVLFEVNTWVTTKYE
jgi:hypothetical protein